MELKAARLYKKGVKSSTYIRHGERAAYTTKRKFCVASEDQQRKISYSGRRNSMVWTKQSHTLPDDERRQSKFHGSQPQFVPLNKQRGSGTSNFPKSQDKRVCRYWMSGNCVKGGKCCFIHSWCHFPGVVGMLARLEGHKKDVKGIALPDGSDKLYSASSDGTLRVWDCHTGQCVHLLNLGADAGCLISEGAWVFVGMPKAVKALNIQTAVEFDLEGPAAQVNAMAVGNEMLFAGAADGVITVWEGCSEAIPFKHTATLNGHRGPITCFIVGAHRLYSGSMDGTIRVWDLNNLKCTMVLKGHTNTVTSLLCWDQYLLSSSLDGVIRVWATGEGGELEIIHTSRMEQGVLALSGMHDAEANPIMFCSCNDKTVYVYDLPSLAERGRLFSRHDVGTLQIGPDGLIFTGDRSGKLTVWSLSAKANS